MKVLSIKQMSPAVMSRARNGHTVRLMKGEGTQLVVSPENYNAITNSFLKNKGIQVALSPVEIDANRVVEGTGIFGKKFDKGLKKAGVKKFAYKAAAALKPLAQETIDIGAQAAMMAAPQLAPAIMAAQSTAQQYLDDPKSLQGKKGLRELKKRAINVGVEAAAPLAAEYGVDMKELKAMIDAGASSSAAPMSMAGVRAKGEDAVLSRLQQMVDARRATSAPVSTDLYAQMDQDGIIGNGMKMKASKCVMCSGSGLYAGAASGRGMASMAGMPPKKDISKKYVSVSRKLMGGELQALQSQAIDANWAFRYTLPPAYQR